MQHPKERVVAVVGGGLSGLAIAEAIQHRSQGQAVRPIVLEAEDAPGGKVRSKRQDGFVVETGPHGFLGREPKVFELIDRLGLTDEMVRADPASAKRFLVSRGKLREVKMSPFGFMTSGLLSPWGRLRVVMEAFVKADSKAHESVADFATRRIGKEAARVMVDAMVTGIYGGDPEDLALEAAFPRMVELEENYGSLIRAQFALAKERRDETEDEKERRQNLHSFRNGLQTLVDGLANAVPDVRTSATVDRIVPTRDGFELMGSFGKLRADSVVSCVPASALARMLEGAGPQALVQRATDQRFAPVNVVVLGFNAKDIRRKLNGFGYLAPHSEGRDLLGCVWGDSVFPQHAPDGQVLLRCMMGGMRNSGLTTLDDGELVDRCRMELVQMIGLDPEALPTMQAIFRWPEGIPQYDAEHSARLTAAHELEHGLPGLVIAGNSYTGVAMIECIANAEHAAERALREIVTAAAA